MSTINIIAAPNIAAFQHSRPRMTSTTRSILFLLVAYLVLYGFLALTAPNFVSAVNHLNIMRHASLIAIIGVGMTMVIIASEIDLAVGSLSAFSGIIVASLVVSLELPLPVAIAATLAVGALSGAFIAFFKVVFNIPSFITSLALLTALRSGCYLISDGFPIGPMPEGFSQLANGTFLSIPWQLIIMLAIYAAAYLAMSHTPWGRSVYAVGGNEEAARLSGISVPMVKFSVFMVTGALAALAGIMLVARLNSGTPTAAEGWELDIIAAVIIGGTSLYGGRGSILGTLLGAMFMATLKTGMVLHGVSPYSQGVISGAVILVAVLVGAIQLRRR